MKNSKSKMSNILQKLVSLLDSDKYRQKFLGATDKPLLFLKNADSNNLNQAVISNEQPNDLIQKNVVNKIN